MGVGVPRHLLGCRELQLGNAKAGALGVLGTTLDFVKLTGVLDWLRLVHDGLSRIIRPHRVVMGHVSLPLVLTKRSARGLRLHLTNPPHEAETAVAVHSRSFF